MATMTGSQGTIPANRPGAPQLSSNELKMMLGQCLKMASENKITGQNTWGLPLIEHLDDLIREDGSGQNTNFQRASVTLDAGVKIYSYRVDSVHTETFKILGGLGRAAGPGQELDGEHPSLARAALCVSPTTSTVLLHLHLYHHAVLAHCSETAPHSPTHCLSSLVTNVQVKGAKTART